MIREALRHYPYVSLTLVALLLFIGAWARVLVGALRASSSEIDRTAELPLGDV